jgi:NADH-quinone oxidoreductase subunit N
VNAPLLWIVFPGLAAAALLFLRRWEKLTAALGTALALLLALLAWRLPIDQTIILGPLSFKVASVLPILGRRFEIGDLERPELILIYASAAFWFAGSVFARATWNFVPVGLAMAALFVAAISVQPFLYAALLIEMAVLVSVPLLSPPGRAVSRGVTRYLIFQSLGMPFILFTGWLLAGVEASPGDSAFVVHVAVLMGLGLAFLLAVFPFHDWIPMLAEESHPYVAAFVFFMLPLVVLLFGLGLLDRYAWLRTAPALYTALRLAGGLLALTGGVWAAFQHNLGRIMGYAVLVEIGLSILALSPGYDDAGGLPLLGSFFSLLLPRGLALALWALALTVIQSQAKGLRFRHVQGIAMRMPVAAGALLVAHFSLAGFPILAGFPARLALWDGLARSSPLAAVTALLGAAGLFVAGLRTLAVLVVAPGQEALEFLESRGQQVLLALGGLGLLLIGFFPMWFLPVLENLGNMYPHLKP